MVLLSSTLATLAVVAAAIGPEVRGEIACPSAEEVAVRLGPMVAPDAGLPSGAFVEIADVAANVSGLLDVEVRLRRPGEDAPLIVRRVERFGGCSETAEAVAVIAASWAGGYATPALPALPDSALPEPAGAVAQAAATAAPTVRAPLDTRFSIGAVAGIVAATSGGSAAVVGGEVEGRRGRWVARLAVVGMGERTVAVSTGSAGWRRLTLLPTMGMVFGSERAFAELGVGAAVAVTETRGLGFGTTNATDTGIDAGVAPAFRLGARLAALPATVWVGGSALFWLRPHGVSVTGGSGSKPLPRLDGFIGGGVTFLIDS